MSADSTEIQSRKVTDSDEFFKNFLGVEVLGKIGGEVSRGKVTRTLGPVQPLQNHQEQTQREGVDKREVMDP